MTQAVPHLVNRLVIDTEDSFDEVRRRYKSLVPAINFAELSEVADTGDLAALQAYTAEHTPHSFCHLLDAGPDAGDAAIGTPSCAPSPT